MAKKDKFFTEKRIETFCNSLQAGNYILPSLAYAGINKDTYYTWRRKGMEAVKEVGDGDISKHKHARYAAFNERVKEAEAASEVGLVAIWRKEAKTDWRGARDLLGRRFPERWSKQETHNVNLKTKFNITEPEPPEDTDGEEW